MCSRVLFPKPGDGRFLSGGEGVSCRTGIRAATSGYRVRRSGHFHGIDRLYCLTSYRNHKYHRPDHDLDEIDIDIDIDPRT